MRTTIPIIPSHQKVQLDIELIDDFNAGIGIDNKYPKKIIYSIPPHLIMTINQLIENQNSLMTDLDKILKSRIGKSIINLEEGMKHDEQK